jgi:hypothetical protein
LRIKSAAIKKNAAEARKLKALFGTMAGIQNLDVNLITGSILIRYNPDEVSDAKILRMLIEDGYFEPTKAVTHDDLLHTALTRAGKAIGSLAVGALEIDSPALAVLATLI